VAVNRTKVLEAAQKFLSKGQYDKAIAEYQKLVVEDPRDVRTLLKIGDLHTKRNKPKDAIEVYLKVAELYAKQGFFLKAVAVYKQILKLDPTHLDSSQRLAKMYEELALTSDALNTYEHVADAYLAQGQVDKALETMERMVELDGQNVAVRIKYAEALSKADKTKAAAKAFAEGAALLKEQGRMDDYIRVVERQLYHDAENLELARNLSSLYLERQDPKRALAKLQICFKADPRDVQTLEMLAEAFRQLGQIPKTISVLKEISRLHAEFGATEARKRTLKRVLDLDPNDAEARQGLGAPAPAPAQAQRTGPGAAQPQKPAAAPVPQERMPTATQIERMAPNEPQRTIRGLAPTAQAAVAAAAALTAERAQAAQAAQAQAAQAQAAQAQAAQAAQARLAQAQAAQAQAAQAAQLAKNTRAPSSFPPLPDDNRDPELSLDAGDEYDLLEAGEDDDADFLSDDADGDADEVLIIDDRTDRHPEPDLADAKPSTATARQQETKPERITRLLSDADAHEGYGLHDKVEALLKEVLSLDPEHLPARERLKDLYVATDRRVEATRELLWLSDAWNDRNRSRAIQYARDAYDLAPHAAATKNRLAALGVNPAQESAEDVMFVEESRQVEQPFSPPIRREEPRVSSVPPLSVPEERALVRAEEDPLDVPISPDEFDAPPPMQTMRRSNVDYADLLDEEVSPEDFDREPAQAASRDDDLDLGGLGDDMDPLDAPISPDEFDAPPPRRSMVGPSDVGDLLDRPQPDDDFGLSDERFDRSGLIEADADSTEIGDAVEIRAAVALAKKEARPTVRPSPTIAQVQDDDEPSVEFVEVGTGELDVEAIEAAEAENAVAARAKAGREQYSELGTGEIEFDGGAHQRETSRGISVPRPKSASFDLPPVPPPSPRKPSVQDMPPLPALGAPGLPAVPAFAPKPAPMAAKPAPVAAKPAPAPAPMPVAAPVAPLARPRDSEADFGSLNEPEPTTAEDAAFAFQPPAAKAEAELLFIEPEADLAPEPDTDEQAVEAPAVDSDLTPEIEETLDEADFFASQGMMDEAVELVQEAILIYPGNRALRAKMLEYEAAADVAEAQAEADADAKKNEDDSFDIAEQLADNTGASGPGAAADEMVDVESVFAQFKKGVSEQIDIDDSETHFDLGIAYKEMGLTNDAMQEFEIAARGEKRACAALTMIGTCALEQGDLERAVAQFHRALATSHKSPGEELALQYEIGNAYEMLGQIDRAIKAFELAAMRDRSFRSVGQRLDQLKKKRGSSMADDAEVDAALDELLGGE